MRKRWRLLLGLALVAVVVAVIGHIIRSQWLPAEPVVQGKALSFWLPRAIMENPGGVHYNQDHYREAVAAAGPAAVPFILAKLRKSDSSLANTYRHLWPRLPSLLQRFLPKPKAPDYFAFDAAAALMCLGTNAIPSLEDAIDDGDPGVRAAAAQALCGFAGGALSTADTARIFGRAIKDGDPAVRVFAAFALARIGPAASNAVPALIRALDASQKNLAPMSAFYAHAGAATALAAIGSRAAPAIPVLTRLLPRADHETQCVFSNALRALEPPTEKDKAE
jgi:HEAT repeat protein